MIRLKRIGIHFVFWLAASLFIWLFIGSKSPDELLVLVFLALLMPITIVTSYVINYYLIAEKLLKGDYVEFAIYGIFIFVASIYLQALLVMFAFALYADYSFGNIGPVIGNVLYLGVCTYFVILLSAIIFLLRKKITQAQIDHSGKESPAILQVMSNRKTVLIELNDILFIESMSNYVKIHTPVETIITKEKISKLEERLPENFLRVHRSFLVNQQHIEAFGKESLTVNQVQLNISRTYKNTVLERLNGIKTE